MNGGLRLAPALFEKEDAGFLPRAGVHSRQNALLIPKPGANAVVVKSQRPRLLV